MVSFFTARVSRGRRAVQSTAEQKPKVTTKHWVLRPGKGMRLQVAAPTSNDLRVVYILQEEHEDIRGVQVTLTPAWKMVADRTRHRNPDRRKEAQRLFEEYMDGKGGVIPPIDLALKVKGIAQGFQGDPEDFLDHLWGYCIEPGDEHKKLDGRWHKLDHWGTRGKHYSPANFPPLWVIPVGAGIVVYDAGNVPAEVHWPREKQPAPWNKAIKVETCEEVVEAIKKLSGPYARKLYGNLAPAAPGGQPNRQGRSWWQSLIRRA